MRGCEVTNGFDDCSGKDAAPNAIKSFLPSTDCSTLSGVDMVMVTSVLLHCVVWKAKIQRQSSRQSRESASGNEWKEFDV